MSWYWIPIAGFLAMDRRSAFNLKLSRPIVIAGIIGIISGQYVWCLLGGVFFELIGLMEPPVGTRTVLDDTFGAFCYSLTISSASTVSVEIALFMGVISYFLMLIATYSSSLVMSFNLKLLNRFMLNGIDGREGRLIFWGQVIHFARGAIVYSLLTILSIRVYEMVLTHVSFKPITLSTLLIFTFLSLGYFCGFFHSIIRTKLMILLSGGLFAWLLL